MDINEEKILVRKAQEGNSEALSKLLRTNQSWIYNIVLRMTGNRSEAEDVTQEILIKALTGLSRFQGKSRFRTWLYRIASNHLLSMKKKGMEHMFLSFDNHESIHSGLNESDFPDDRSPLTEQVALINETKGLCLSGMLLCLDRQQRLVFILGAIYALDSSQGGEILEMTPENFRKILSRARGQLKHYIEGRCSLVDKENPCRCSRKTKAMIEMGYVHPDHLSFSSKHVEEVRSVVQINLKRIGNRTEKLVDGIFLEQPFVTGPDFSKYFQDLFLNGNSQNQY